jgi:hypothetical protein
MNLWTPTKRVAPRERTSIVQGRGHRHARADRIAGSKKGAEIRLKSDPQRRHNQMVPTTMR